MQEWEHLWTAGILCFYLNMCQTRGSIKQGEAIKLRKANFSVPVQQNFSLVSPMKALANWVGVFRLQHAVKFLNSSIDDSVGDTLPLNYLALRTCMKYVQ